MRNTAAMHRERDKERMARGELPKYLPAEPFAEWVEQKVKYYGGLEQVAEQCRVTPKVLRRYWSWHKDKPIEKRDPDGKRGIRLATADQIFSSEGTTMIYEVYPWLLE